jgi:tetratricopeptide (TPR) repeat protein
MSLLKQTDDELSSQELNLKRALKGYLEETTSPTNNLINDKMNEAVTTNVHPSQSAMEKLQRAYMDLGYWEESLHLEQYKCAVYLKPDTDEYGDSIHAAGKFYLRQDDFQNSQRLYQEALQYFETRGNAVQRGHVLISIAGWYYFRNQLDEALESLTEAERLLNSNPALLVKCLDNQGLIYRLWGDFDTALDKYQQALQVVVDRDTEWALRLHTGDMFMALDDPTGALKVYQDLLQETTVVSASLSNTQQQPHQEHLIEQILGMQGVLMHNIATIHVDQGEFIQALEEFKQSLHLKKSAPGGEHNPEVAKTLNSLGALYAGIFDEKMHALDCFQQALLIARIHAAGDPKTDPDVQSALQNIATMEQALYQEEQKKS